MIYDILDLIFFFFFIMESFLLLTDLSFSFTKSKLLIVLFTNIMLVCLFSLFANYNDILGIFLVGISICIFFKENILKIGGLYFLLCICFYQIKINILFIWYYSKLDFDYKIGNCCINCIIVVMFTCLYLFIRRYMDKLGNKIKIHKFRYFAIIEVFSLTIIAAFLISYIRDSKNGFTKQELDFYFYTAIVSIILVLLGFIINQIIIQNIKYKQLLEVDYKYIKQQQIYYNNMIQQQEHMRKLHHDLKHHIYMLKTFIINKKYKNAELYLDTLYGKLDFNVARNYCNNIIIDSIINEYIYLIQKNKISFSVDGKFPDDIKIEDYDLCVIFSNLLLNSIESCLLVNDENKRKITTSLSNTGLFIGIKIQNTYSILTKDMKTIKSDKLNHGIGLKNVIDIVESNNGNIEFSHDNDMFCVNIILQGTCK